MKPKKMRTFWYTAIIKVIVLVVYSLVLLKIVSLSREVQIRDVVANTNGSTLDAQIDICYPLRLSKQSCHPLDDPDKEELKTLAEDCKWEDDVPIGCCTKDLKKPSEIIEKFEEKIKDLVKVSGENTKEPLQDNQVIVQFDQICVKYSFTDLKQPADNGKSISLEIQSNKSNYQSFDIHLSFIRKNQIGEEYLAARSNLIRRKCWATKTHKECLETGKDVTIEVEYYSIRSLKKPFVTSCREDKETPADCYEKCVKREKPHFLMTYNKSDEMDLKFGPHDYKKCSRACVRPSCFTATFYIKGIDEKENQTYLESSWSNSTFPGLITLKILNAPNGIDSVPVLSSPRFNWMIALSVAVFMGIDCYGIFIKTTKLYSESGNQVKNPKRSQVRVFFGLFIFSVCFTLAFFCEKILFDFGADPGPYNETYLTEIESLRERNVSISVCFDLCDVWKEKSCNKTSLSSMNLKELNSKTRGVLKSEKDPDDWFRNKVSLKNNVKYAPIRQKDNLIPTFYRNNKKCWLVSYAAPNVLPYLSVQRKSFIHLTLQPGTPTDQTPNYSHFYVVDGDGLAFPSIDAQSTRKSVLHSVQIQYEKEPCKDYNANVTSYFATREDLVQRCIVRKFAEEHKRLPTFVNLKLDNEKTFEQYLDLPFGEVSRETRIRLIEECEKASEKQCTKTVTTLTNFELLEEQLGIDPDDLKGQYIVVNLTPILFEKKYYERENYLIVFNRLLSFITLFTCYSVTDVVKNLIGTYFYSFIWNYSFQFVKRFSYIFVFFAYLIHLSVLIHTITHSVSKVYDTEIMDTVEFPLIRLCYEHGFENKNETLSTYVDWEEVDGPKLEAVNKKSLAFDKLVKRIFLFDEAQNYTELNLSELSKRNDFEEFYVDALKCFSFKIDKSYDARNPIFHKSERLLEIHIDLKNMEKSKKEQKMRDTLLREEKNRVFLFLNDQKTLNLDQWNPFESNATIYYLTRAVTFEDAYWIWNNFEEFVKRLLIGPEPYGLFPYLDGLSKAYGEEQSLMTTSVPLVCNQNTSDPRCKQPLRNRKFASFIHFRTLDAPYKNEYQFSETAEMESYYMVRLTEKRLEKKPDELRLSLKPNLVRLTTRFINNYTVIELFFHIVALTKIYFKFNFIEIPELAQRAWPVVQFFAFLCLYLFIRGLIKLSNHWFRLAKFMDMKHA